MRRFVVLKSNIYIVILIYNKEFLILGIHSLPLCPKSKTEKEILKFFKTIPSNE